MVCTKCMSYISLRDLIVCSHFLAAGEKKLSKLAVPDKWKAEKEAAGPGGSPHGRVLAKNTLLSKGQRYNPFSKKCKLCQATVHLENAEYCQTCAYKGGICPMCGDKVVDTKSHRMSTV